MRRIVTLAAIAFLSLGPAAMASSNVISRVDANYLYGELNNEGFSSAEILNDDVVAVKLDGFKVGYLIQGGGQNIQVYFSVSDADVSLRKINEWNSSKRFSRAYIDGDGDPVLMLDLDLEGGITEDRLHNFFVTVNFSLRTFMREVL